MNTPTTTDGHGNHVGDIRTIYTDPVKCKHPEGRACLLKYLGAFLWDVRFLHDDDQPDPEEPVVQRRIYHNPGQGVPL